MKRWRMIVGIVLLAGFAGTASAENWRPYRPGRRPIPPREAVSIAQRQQEGRVLSTQLVRTGEGRGYYRIKMISDGKVRVVTVDAYPGN
jgi:uncharacterized membrane protein YkoI